MRVLAALSGGVDSAVAAALACEEGHQVTGVTMSIWREGRYKGGERDACFGPGEASDIEAAGEVCRILGIPHRVVDCAEAYERIVLADFRSSFLGGLTPNPCVRCNALVKFGVLPAMAEKAGITFDRIVTGHYVRLEHGDDRVRMRMAEETRKDQSYFLYRLSQRQLRRLHAPLGTYDKQSVREMAGRFGLPVRDKPDSQDFYSGDHRELLRARPRPGRIVHTSGKCMGEHRGFWHFTIGQRKGLGISHPTPLYVVGIDADANEVTVGDAEEAVSHGLTAAQANWISVEPPESAFSAVVKVRSSGWTTPCRVTPDGPHRFHAAFDGGIAGVAPGQSAVLYRDGLLLGGGIITATE